MEVAEKQHSYTITDEKVYQIALSMVPYVGGTMAKQLISYCGSAKNVFIAPSHLLHRIPGIGSKIIHAIKNSEVVDKACKETEICLQKGIQIITHTEAAFPFRLKQIYDAPSVIYYKGTADLDHTKIISIVGTRRATPYGKQMVEELVSAFAPYNPLIVSGLAYGIDIYAHRAALSAGMQTVGVMASGLDIIYPAVHRKDASEMLRQGGLLTEHPMGSKLDARKFPARNRLIAGLADVTIVIEAAEKGGALITANLANDYDREVFAVPGSLHQPYSKGCNTLIKQHKAHILTKAEDLLEVMQWDIARPAQHLVDTSGNQLKNLDCYGLTDQEKTIVLKLIDFNEGLVIDELSWRTEVPVYQLAADLIQLEFKGLIKACPGKRFKIAIGQLTVS